MNKFYELSPSQEDYLETILLLEQKNRVARVKDISEKLSVRMPSVTGALKNLRKLDLISYEKNSYISLTQKGLRIAECVLDRHRTILDFFTRGLGLEGEWVENQACKIEHAINHETSVRIKNLTKWLMKTVFDEKQLSSSEWIKLLRERSERSGCLGDGEG